MTNVDGLVSVITPAYNAEQYVLRAIECVNNQTIKVLEHIVIDDGSSDKTWELLRSLGEKYPHLKIISQNNFGAGVARNEGVKIASGKYISFLDADDIWNDTKLEVQISFMEKNNFWFTYGSYEEFSELEGRALCVRKVPEHLTYKQLLKGCPIGCLTAAYNQEELGKCYMPDIRRGQDWGLWLYITKLGIVAHRYPEVLARYTVIKGSLSKNKIKKAFDMFRIYRRQGLGNIQSLYYLILHIKYYIVKNNSGDL
jgi:teichuronic acid biosynthesis glycosyltransferase TuaG